MSHNHGHAPKPIYFSLPHINNRVWNYSINKFHMNTKRYPELKDKEVFIMMILETYEEVFEHKNKLLKDYGFRIRNVESEVCRLKGELHAKKRLQEI